MHDCYIVKSSYNMRCSINESYRKKLYIFIDVFTYIDIEMMYVYLIVDDVLYVIEMSIMSSQ